MTNQEFDQCKLTRRLAFAESEAARLVLVHGETIKTAASIYRQQGITIQSLLEVLELFNAYNSSRTK